MRNVLLSVFGALALVTMAAAPVAAAPCKDAKGKFVKCPEKHAKPVSCKDARGKFVKCSAPGAKPVK